MVAAPGFPEGIISGGMLFYLYYYDLPDNSSKR